MSNQRPNLYWRDTQNGQVPISAQFDDPYYSLDDGLAETKHVFLDGNNLPERFCDGFHIAELGFGTGLNFLATMQLWASAPCGHLHFTSFEAFPITADAAAQALAGFPQLAPFTPALIQAWDDIQITPTVITQGVSLHVIIGDARDTLPQWQGAADAWFLDGFSPAKNPALWAPELLKSVAEKTKQRGTCATYTAAGHVRRGLADAGFEITRIPGYGRKRHMSVGAKI
jgi:tRNA U34 5-methylaminomethyl-2-thiouridine-forming methyltransferase MnmC